MTRFMRVFLQALRLGTRDFGAFFTLKSFLGAWMVRMITNALMWVMLGQLLGSRETLEYLLVGIAISTGVGSTAAAASTWDRSGGTYPLLVVSPLGPAAATLGRSSVWALSWIPSSILTFAVVCWIIGWRFPAATLAWLPLMITVICFGAWGMCGFLGSVIGGVPKLRNIINNVYLTVLMAFTGVSVPVRAWPEPIQALAQVLPITHGLAAIRVLLAQGPVEQVIAGALLEILVGCGWLALAIFFFRRLADRGRVDGSIDYVGN